MLLPQVMEISFNKYDNLLALHLDKMSDLTKRPDLNVLNFERDRAFEDLKNRLGSFLKNIRKSDDDMSNIIHACQKRIEAVLKLNDLLKRRMTDYQKELSRKRQEMNMGKRALSGYATGSSSQQYTKGRYQKAINNGGTK